MPTTIKDKYPVIEIEVLARQGQRYQNNTFEDGLASVRIFGNGPILITVSEMHTVIDQFNIYIKQMHL